jgi:hypothetical protein
MKSSRLPILALLLGVALAGAGCGDDSSSTPTEPSLPTITDNFSGTIGPNGASVHAFRVAGAGTVTATLTSVSLESGATPPAIGFSLGYVSGLTCSAVVSNDFAAQGAILTGRTTVTSTLCLRVFDGLGLVTDPVSYTIEVKHP